MTPEHIKAFDQLFDHIYKGDRQSKELSFKILETSHTWDDLVDKDVERSGNDVNKAFFCCLFEFNKYPIWSQAGLEHHLLNVFLRWQDANSIESDKESTKSDMHKSYMLRAGLYDIFVIIALYLHGFEWAKEVGPVVRRFYGEKLEDYLLEFNCA